MPRVAGWDLLNICVCACLEKPQRRFRWRPRRVCSINERATGIGISSKHSASLPTLCRKSKPEQVCAFQMLLRFAGRHWQKRRLVTIVGDGAANNIGAGCSTKDKIALMIGTSGAMRVVFAGEPPDELAPALWCYRVSRSTRGCWRRAFGRWRARQVVN